MSSIPDSHRKIIEEAPVVMLATIPPWRRPAGHRNLVPLDGDTLRLSMNTSRQKVRNMLRNPAVSAVFLDPSTPYRTLELRGTARIEDDPDYVLAAKVGEKYGGADLRSMDRPGDTRVSVTLDIQKVITYGQ